MSDALTVTVLSVVFWVLLDQALRWYHRRREKGSDVHVNPAEHALLMLQQVGVDIDLRAFQAWIAWCSEQAIVVRVDLLWSGRVEEHVVRMAKAGGNATVFFDPASSRVSVRDWRTGAKSR